MKKSKIIKWTNIYSGEIGYVQMIRHTKGHFVNTSDKAMARKYRSHADAQKAIETLISIGEGQSNVFTILDA
jgi:hypothetical protein